MGIGIEETVRNRFHDRVVAAGGRSSASKCYAITESGRNRFLTEARELPGTVLEYGCSDSGFLATLALELFPRIGFVRW